MGGLQSVSGWERVERKARPASRTSEMTRALIWRSLTLRRPTTSKPWAPREAGAVHRIALGAVVAAALVFAPTAGAAVTASSVTTPADGAGFDVDDDTPGQITVTGTATADDPATDTVRLACTYSEQPSGSAASLAPAGATRGLTPTGAHTGSFSIQVPPNHVDY